MEASILKSVKKMLHVDPSYTVFDDVILEHINSVCSTLTQIGVGPKEGVFVENDQFKWEDLLESDHRFNAVRSYMFLRVQLLFDGDNLTSYAIQMKKEQISEMEYRLNVTHENDHATDPETGEPMFEEAEL